MRGVFVLALTVGVTASFSLPAIAQSASQPPPCEALVDKQQRGACFQRMGVPVVDCDHPANPDDATFCNSLGGSRQPRSLDSLEAPHTYCDNYAAHELEPQRMANPVALENINAALAVPACESAVQQYPTSTRLLFQLGRAYQRANDFVSAAAQYRKAADRGYPLAQTNSVNCTLAARAFRRTTQRLSSYLTKQQIKGTSERLLPSE